LISVVIPAHNEEQVIGRCLDAMLAGAEPGEFDVIVVTNGCTDRTAEVAAAYAGVRVVDSPRASKPAALTLGDEVATGFPRMYVDADVEVGAPALRAVGDVLQQGTYELAAPVLRAELEGRPWGVRAYYEVWSRLPYARDDLVGVGFYGMSERGRARFGDFPDTMAEDFFVHSLFPASARRAVPDHSFTIHPPLTVGSLVKIQTRIHAANRRNKAMFEAAADELHAGHVRELLRLAREPRMTAKVAGYVGIVGVAKLKARWKNRSATVGVWDRDTTARAGAGSR
jgi:glycosyltransferase involved in cell wall biosynthesis